MQKWCKTQSSCVFLILHLEHTKRMYSNILSTPIINFAVNYMQRFIYR